MAVSYPFVIQGKLISFYDFYTVIRPLSLSLSLSLAVFFIHAVSSTLFILIDEIRYLVTSTFLLLYIQIYIQWEFTCK